MRRAGWTQADDVDLASSRRIIVSTLTRRSYEEAPVSPLFIFGRQQDFAYQEEVDGSPGKRHHVRFWRCPPGWVLPGGVRVDWLAAGTYDRAVGLSLFTLQITHKIGENTDDERDHILAALKKAAPEAEVTVIRDFSTGLPCAQWRQVITISPTGTCRWYLAVRGRAGQGRRPAGCAQPATGARSPGPCSERCGSRLAESPPRALVLAGQPGHPDRPGPVQPSTACCRYRDPVRPHRRVKLRAGMRRSVRKLVRVGLRRGREACPPAIITKDPDRPPLLRGPAVDFGTNLLVSRWTSSSSSPSSSRAFPHLRQELQAGQGPAQSSRRRVNQRSKSGVRSVRSDSATAAARSRPGRLVALQGCASGDDLPQFREPS